MLNINPNEVSSCSQKRAILTDLLAGQSRTGLEAIDLFGCIKLSNRISELRAMGIEIRDRWIHTNSGKRIKQYFITHT